MKPHVLLRPRICQVVLTVLVLAQPLMAQQSLPLTNYNHVHGAIVAGDRPEGRAVEAAGVLQQYLYRMSRILLPVQTISKYQKDPHRAKTVILVGPSRLTQEMGIKVEQDPDAGELFGIDERLVLYAIESDGSKRQLDPQEMIELGDQNQFSVIGPANPRWQKLWPELGRTAGPSRPFDLVWGQAYHILPGTHTESGYFSLTDGIDGKMYVGTTRYNVNSYLVEFDPATEQQKIVIDTHKLCQQPEGQFAPQEKIHSRNFTGPSGTVYCGSMQSFAEREPGGYAMSYNPVTGQAKCLGIPRAKRGLSDVAADETRGLLYAVTAKPDNRWLLGNIQGRRWRELGPLSVRFGNTLIDGRGRANLLMADSRLARYDPQTRKIMVRDILSDGQKLPDMNYAEPTWRLGPDGRISYVITSGDTTLWSIDLYSPGRAVQAKRIGRMLDIAGTCKSGMDVGANGEVYAVFMARNYSGYGPGKLQHLTRYDPQTGRIEDLGVLGIREKPALHGFTKLPDGALTLGGLHYALKVNKDGDVYMTAIQPLVLVRVKKEDLPESGRVIAEPAGAQAYLDIIQKGISESRADMKAISASAEEAAKLYLAGGKIYATGRQGEFADEALNRAGGFMSLTTISRGGPPAKGDIILYAAPDKLDREDLKNIGQWRSAGAYVVAFAATSGPAGRGTKPNDLIGNHQTGLTVRYEQRDKLIPADAVLNVINMWAWTGEFVAACTRAGKMPTMYMSYNLPGGMEREAKYHGQAVHEDMQIVPIPAGQLGGTYLDFLSNAVDLLRNAQIDKIRLAAQWWRTTNAEQVVIQHIGHMFPAHLQDPRSPQPVNWKEPQTRLLTIALAYQRGPSGAVENARKSGTKLVYASSRPCDPAEPTEDIIYIAPHWPITDACVEVSGYDVPILPGSGVMNAIIYWSLLAEVCQPAAEKVN